MKKTDLIALIESLPDDADIRFAQPTHDHWRTQLAIDPDRIEEVKVSPSAYHNDRDAVQADGEWDEDLDTVYLIS